MLKKKNEVQRIIDRRLKTLESLETILLKIEASQNDLQVRNFNDCVPEKSF